MTKTTLIEFPCAFPIKIIGIHSQVFIEDIKQITAKHFADFSDEQWSHKPSQNHNYIAITVTVIAQNQEMLDNFYREISAHPHVKMVL